MKMSTRGRYGLRVMLELAINYGKTPVVAESIARSQEISENYIHMLVKSLKDSGLLVACRGPNGGYMLAKPPAQITVLEIINAMEGKTAVVDCIENKSSCSRSGSCIARSIWVRVNLAIDTSLEKITLGEIIGDQSRGEQEPFFYQI